MSGATVLTDLPSLANRPGEILLARIANTDRCPYPRDVAGATLGDSSGSLTYATHTVTIVGDHLVGLTDRDGRTIYYHGFTLKVSVIPFGTWKACGCPGVLRPLTGYQVPPFKLEGLPRAQVRDATAGAFTGIIEGAEPITMKQAASELDAVTPRLWALENDRGSDLLTGAGETVGDLPVYATWFNVIAVIGT